MSLEIYIRLQEICQPDLKKTVSEKRVFTVEHEILA